MWQERESGVGLRGNNGLRATIMTDKLFSAASEQLTEEPLQIPLTPEVHFPSLLSSFQFNLGDVHCPKLLTTKSLNTALPDVCYDSSYLILKYF